MNGIARAIPFIVLCLLASAPQSRSQTPSNTGDSEAQASQQWSPAVPVRIIEDANKERLAEEREREAQELQRSDLEAQWKAANAAAEAARYSKEQLTLAWWQLLVSAIGTMGLFVTLHFNFKALRQAEQSSDKMQELGQKQVRAYISWKHAEYGIITNEIKQRIGFHVRAVIQNTGQSPATMLKMFTDIVIKAPGEHPDQQFDATGSTVGMQIGAGSELGMASLQIPMDDSLRIFGGEAWGFLLGWGEYADVFHLENSPPHQFRFCFRITFITHPQNADARLDFHTTPEYSFEPAPTNATA